VSGEEGRRPGSGYALVALLATVAIMMVLMAAAVPSWRYLMKNDREEELIFRGGQIADAIGRYQKKNGNALPPSLEVLVKGKYLRRAYKDPMTRSGQWRFIHPGQSVGPIRPPGSAGGPTTTTTTTTRPSAFTQPAATLGGIQGVASTSHETSLRVFNGRTRYDEWVFLPGQPRVVGRQPGPPGTGIPRTPGAPAPGPGPPGRPGTSAPGSGPSPSSR
jgi:type II secretory pathway pseudopilin PulG